MEIISTFFEGFMDPRKRVCLLYLGSALAIGMLWLVICQRRSLRSAFGICFSREAWWSVSARQDYALLFLNKVFFLLISQAWFSSTVATYAIFELLHEVVPVRPNLELSKASVVILFTLSIFLLDDFTKYLVHWLLHNVRCLWVFHKVHHSATSLTPFTIFRTHPIEMLLFSARSIFVRAFVIAVFVFFFGDGVDLYTVLGVNIGLFIFHILGSNLRHSHIYIGYWDWLEKWLISPAQHQVHHSANPNHHGKNLGVVLAVWDRLAGTLMTAPKYRTFDFGFAVHEQNRLGTLKYVYLNSFVEGFRILCNPFLKRPIDDVKKTT